MHKFLKLPLTYEQTSFDDERFMKVRVKVMHNGLNLNKSNFSDEAIGKAANTLSNIPLLAYTKVTDGTNESDFAGHEFEIKITENGMKYSYLGRPVGMIPETNNYSFGEDEDGKKFVSVDGYIWKDYANEALDIIQRDGGKKVSMEIKVDEYEDNDSVLDILNYRYTGITLLGEDVREAMMGARADIAEFSEGTMQEFLANFSADLNSAMAINEVEPKTEPEVVEEEIIEPTTEPAEEPVVEPEQPEANPVVIEPGKVEVVEEDSINPPEEPEAEDTDFETVKAENENLKAQLAELQESFEALKVEKENLDKFKTDYEKENFTKTLTVMLEQFSDLEETEISEVVTNNNNLEDIELKLFALRGRKGTVKKDSIQTFSIVDSLIAKQSASESGPSWASLIEKYDQN